MKKVINTTNAPKAVGPYSQAILSNNTIYVSGQLPIDPKTNEFISDEITSQTKQSLENMLSILKEANMDLSNVVKTTVYLSDIANFAKMNEVYMTYFKEPYPARSAFAVKSLPKDALVEIECIASL